MSIVRNSYESEVCEYLAEEVAPYFFMKREVWGEHITGRRKRIDAIIYPKLLLLDNGFPKIPVGIEIKTNELDDGNKKQVIELYHQSIIYRHTRFEMKSGMEFLPLILIYPPIDNYMRGSAEKGEWSEDCSKGFNHIATRLSGKFFIGELFLRRDLENGDILKIRLCAIDYYRIKKDGSGKRYNMPWGFEKYENEKRKLQERVITAEEYKREILKLTELLGI